MSRHPLCPRCLAPPVPQLAAMPAGAVHPYGYRVHCRCPAEIIALRPAHLTEREAIAWWDRHVQETAPKTHPLEVRP